MSKKRLPVGMNGGLNDNDGTLGGAATPPFRDLPQLDVIGGAATAATQTRLEVITIKEQIGIHGLAENERLCGS